MSIDPGLHALGVDVKLVRSGIFGIGCGLAALGGVLAAPLLLLLRKPRPVGATGPVAAE